MCANVSVLPRILLLSGVALLLPVQSKQQSLPAAQPATAFRATARTVVVDVVVDDGGKPVRGLKKEDFNLFEDGNPQTIEFFEPHFEDATHSDAVLRASLLPENTYSNIPVSHVADSVTVLLLDSLNTYTEDQLYVRRQMIQYLKTLPPGRRIAVFTLGSHLRLLQGFGSDATPLLAALNSKKQSAGDAAGAEGRRL
jgi:VWFA-related protein